MSKFCKKCGTEIRDEVEFCPKCGASQIRVNTNVGSAGGYVNQGPQLNPQVSANRGGSNGNSQNIIIAVVAVIAVIVGAFFIVFNGNVDEVKSSLNIGTKQETTTTATTAQPPTALGVTKEKIADFVNRKDSLDVEIGAVAADVNSYLGTHRDFRGADAGRIIDKAKATLDKVESTKKEIEQATFKPEDEALKKALISVLDCEVGRIRGLYKGMLDSKNNGDYSIGFKEGTAAAYRYDDENAKLNSVYKK